ncbi:putative armadillo-like helical protein [Helianthus annuus]|uniref:Armadillo-like helical protein n=1 Tax=Helianthus annuus TaxID=4232 RepID=A0A9K3E8B2_HELAN|nr:putative armadillo-like helical protein [Helianthus annuus]KAJ0839738.1 putative armadillo-like helical protein [Helianthus annuus]
MDLVPACMRLLRDSVRACARLLHDNEAEVRTTAAGKITKFSCILSPKLTVQHILPWVKNHYGFA